jgi:hypothetical protein
MFFTTISAISAVIRLFMEYPNENARGNDWKGTPPRIACVTVHENSISSQFRGKYLENTDHIQQTEGF